MLESSALASWVLIQFETVFSSKLQLLELNFQYINQG